MNLFLKDKNYNSQNPRFICNFCSQSEEKLSRYQEILEDNEYFSKTDMIEDIDYNIFKKIKPIERGFTVSDDDDLKPLLLWYKKM